MLDWPDVIPIEWSVKAVDTNDKNLATFKASIRAAARGLWSGKSDLLDFVDMMYSAIRRGYEQAWREGAETCGVKPNERTPEEQVVLDEMIVANQGYVVRYGDWITEHSQASGFKLQPVLDRAELWVNRYNEVKARGQLMACGDKKYRWQFNPRKESCATCRKLNGKVHRDSVWKRLDVFPRDTRPGKLICHGFNCGCEFVETDEPATPGRPPMLAGGK